MLGKKTETPTDHQSFSQAIYFRHLLMGCPAYALGVWVAFLKQPEARPEA
jgi:hypothetical protein